jgi:4-hydroxybenzoate polyprenyltransferase
MPLQSSATTSIENTSKVTAKAVFLSVIRLIRVQQWVKNLFVFIPSFFAGRLFDLSQLQQLALAALAFCFVASSIYIINDYQDRHLDRLHAKKKFRPIASGEINGVTAWSLAFTFSFVGLCLAGWLNFTFFYLLLAYLVLNFGYSFGLKKIPILDLFIVSTGFILRVYSGGIIAGLHISHWLSLMILLLSLFIIIAKRRDDLIIQKRTGEIVRKSSQAYNLQFINSCLSIISSIMIVTYIMYTVSPEVTERFHSDYLFTTTVFVLAGMMRYLQIIFVEKESGSPTAILFKDKFILITLSSWIVSFYIIIYTS